MDVGFIGVIRKALREACYCCCVAQVHTVMPYCNVAVLLLVLLHFVVG